MVKSRGITSLLLIYLSTIGIVALVGGYAYTKVTVAAVGEPSATHTVPTTILDERIANAREVKAALAKPQPNLEPLPPITATVTAPPSARVTSTEKLPKPKLSREARSSMAMGSTPRTGAAAFSSLAVSSYDRASTEGW